MSRRERRREFHERMEKETMRLIRREDELWKIKMKLSLDKVKLETPIFWGWKRCYKLRSDIARSDDAEFYKEILKVINNFWYSKTKTFKQRMNEHGRRFFSIDDDNNQNLKVLSQKEYDKLTNKQQELFEFIEFTNRWDNTTYYRYVFNRPYVFKFVIHRYYITEVLEFSPEIDSELELIDHRLWDKHWRDRFGPDTDVGYPNKRYHRARAKRESY